MSTPLPTSTDPNALTSTPAETASAATYGRMLIGWLLALVIVAEMTQTRWGRVLVYYSLVLMIVLLVLGSYQRVIDLVGWVRAPGPSTGPAGG